MFLSVKHLNLVCDGVTSDCLPFSLYISASTPPTYTHYRENWVPNAFARRSMYKNETVSNTPAPISTNIDALRDVVQSPQLTKEQAEDSWEALRPQERDKEQSVNRGDSAAEEQLLGDD